MEDSEIFTLFSDRFSIRRFLSIFLLLLVSVCILVLGTLNYFQMKNQNEKLFRMHMVNSAKIIDALISLNIKTSSMKQLSSLLQSNPNSIIRDIKTHLSQKTVEFYNVYKDSFSFQVYNPQDNKVVLRSVGAPKTPIIIKENKKERMLGDTYTSGFFSNKKIQNIDGNWYLFSMDSHYKPYKIVILVNTNFKEDSFLNLFWRSIRDLILLYVFLAFACVFGVQVALNPLAKIANALSKRDPRKLEAIAIKKAPIEVVPLLQEINSLFTKVNIVLEREKHFAGDAAHELKTPLAALKTQAEIALNIEDISEVKQKIRNIISSANHYFHIIDQLLTITRLEPQQALPDIEKLDLNQLVEEWVIQLAPKAIDKDIELEFIANKKPLYFMGNRIFIGILLRNLIDNAIRYTPNEGDIIIIVSQTESKQIRLRVIDTGIGVAKNRLERIFDRFYRQKGTKASGSGLGLSIVKEISRLHYADICAKRPKNGKGLEIELVLNSEVDPD